MFIGFCQLSEDDFPIFSEESIISITKNKRSPGKIVKDYTIVRLMVESAVYTKNKEELTRKKTKD